MPPAGAIRQGGVYVEISADDAPLVRSLAASQARLRAWVAQNQAQFTKATEGALSGEAGGPRFFSGSFKGTELFEGGLKFAAAVGATKAAIADVQIFSALFRGDMEGARAAAEKLPFGLGEITKELGAAADEAAKFMMSWLGHDMQGAYDPAAKARADKDRAAQAKAFNEGNKAIAEAEKALQKATLSAREYTAAEVAGMGLVGDQAERLLALKLRLIEIDEQRKEFARRQAVVDRGEGAIGQAMDEYAKATMSERDFIAYEVRHMGLAENHAQSLLGWKLAILDVTEKQAAAEKRARFDETLGETVAGIQTRVAELRGALDSLGADEERALKPVYEAVGAGTLSFREATEAVDRVKAAFADLRKAQEEANTKKEGEGLTESMRTPEEKARDEISKYKKLLGAGTITDDTYGRAVKKALEDAAAAMPDAMRRTIGVRGTFNAMEAAGLGAGDVSDRIAQATEKTAKNTEKIAQLVASLGVSFN